MSRILEAYARALAALGAAMLIAFTVIVAYQVVSRYVSVVPRFFWTEEMARFTFIWMLFLGAAVAVFRGTHFTIDLFGELTSPRAEAILDIAVGVAILAVSGVMIYGGLQFTGMGWSRTSTTSGIRLAWIYLAIPFCGASMVVFAVHRLMQAVRRAFAAS